jgi:hypothetical protein
LTGQEKLETDADTVEAQVAAWADTAVPWSLRPTERPPLAFQVPDAPPADRMWNKAGTEVLGYSLAGRHGAFVRITVRPAFGAPRVWSLHFNLTKMRDYAAWVYLLATVDDKGFVPFDVYFGDRWTVNASVKVPEALRRGLGAVTMAWIRSNNWFRPSSAVPTP